MKSTVALLFFITTALIQCQDKSLSMQTDKAHERVAELQKELHLALGKTNEGKKLKKLRQQASKITNNIKAEIQPELTSLNTQIETAQASIQNKITPLMKQLLKETDQSEQEKLSSEIEKINSSAKANGKTLKELHTEREKLLKKVSIPKDLSEKIIFEQKKVRELYKTNKNIKELKNKLTAATKEFENLQIKN